MQRKTIYSCGYDIELPRDVKLSRWKWTKIDLSVQMKEGEILPGHFGLLVPRSSSGVKYGLRLRNTVGIIDSDYTMDTIKATVKTEHWIPHKFKKGERLFQLIVVCHDLIPNEEKPTEERVGGHGSTGNL